MNQQENIPRGVTIRQMRMDDYPSLIKLWEKAGLPYKPEGRDRRENIEKELEGEASLFLVAEKEGRIIGSVLGTHDGRKGWINRLAVAPDSRRKGVGRALVAEVELQLSRMGIAIVACLVEDWNEDSIRVFRRLGYTSHPDITYFSKRKHPGV